MRARSLTINGLAHIHCEDCAGRTLGKKGGGCSMNATNVILHTPPVAETENSLVYG